VVFLQENLALVVDAAAQFGHNPDAWLLEVKLLGRFFLVAEESYAAFTLTAIQIKFEIELGETLNPRSPHFEALLLDLQRTLAVGLVMVDLAHVDIVVRPDDASLALSHTVLDLPLVVELLHAEDDPLASRSSPGFPVPLYAIGMTLISKHLPTFYFADVWFVVVASRFHAVGPELLVVP
jgi:hypothetical protein